MLGNPYTPGAGCIPPYLAGREKLLNSADMSLNRLKNGYPQRSIIYYGLRGVGKTVLLNSIENSAENLEIKYAHIEASENNLFMSRLLHAFRRFLRQMSVVESAKALADNCLKLISAFSISYNVSDEKYTLEFSQEEFTSSGILEDDLTEILVALGRCAVESKNAVCIFVDEFQYVTKEQARAIITALHRTNQLRLPIMFFCGGLPKVVQVVSEACSYAERIFVFEEVGKLSESEAEAAITEPAKELNVAYEEEAIKLIFYITEGYPYFIQEFCSTVWESVEECDCITVDMINDKEDEFNYKLDTGFFAARMSRCSKAEQQFMLAMAECEKENCTISDVAHHLGKEVKSISPVRANLINKGMVYAPARGELAFTVPLFSNYVLRTNDIVE